MDSYFDIAIAHSVLHHVLWDECAKEIYRVLGSGGCAVFVEPLEGNAFYRFARRYFPHPGKGAPGVDYPLNYIATQSFISYFDDGHYREFDLFGVPLVYLRRLFRNRNRHLFSGLKRILMPIGERIIRNSEYYRRFCRTVVIRVEKH